MKRLTAAVVALCLSGLFAQAEDAHLNIVKTTGTAELKVTPDQASIQIGVERQSVKARNAKAAVAEVSRKILAALKALGVEDKDVQTAYLFLQPMIDYRNGLRISNFTAEQSLSVKLRDLSKLDDVMDAVVTAGANRIDGVEYESSELQKYKQQARDAAAKAAREKAEALVAALGSQLGNTHSIEEVQPGDGYNYIGGFAGNRFRALPAAKPVAPSTAPGELTVTASVVVSFELL